MINRNEFKKQLDRLTEVYSPLSDTAVEEYYNQLKFFEIGMITQAVDVLISAHSGEFTPKPPEILATINEIRRQSSTMLPDEEAPPPECQECNSTGFKTWTDKHGRLKATPCLKCAKGQGIVNAPIINRKPDYPGGWREAYQVYKGRLKPRVNTGFDRD